ncbi:MAG: lysine-sensitive aspartokinase 3 [Candidatus Kapabacteria bacterium]|nr:lysine-sensitive aspartokinase 3 [Candidatus Kapabacteria bacterium]
MKFGGTSVQNDEAIRRVISIINNRKAKAVIVVSAFATITNKLVEIINCLKKNNYISVKAHLDYIFTKHLDVASKLGLGSDVDNLLNEKRDEIERLTYALNILGEVSPKSTDTILSFGEILSSKIIYHAFLNEGFKIKYVDARDIIRTDANFTEANVIFDTTNELIINNCKDDFENYQLILTAGFIASDENKSTTTLGRGGSDYSAALIASALDAERLEIWTDVNGIMTCDPRIIPQAKLVKMLSYTEASELAYFGAKVLHPKTIYPAVEKQIPVYVLNTFNPENNGSEIINLHGNKKILKAIAFRRGVSVINIQSNKMLGAYGFLSKVFEIFRLNETSVDLITTSEVSISLTIDDNSKLNKIINDLREFATIILLENQAIICIVGEGIKNTSGISARFFQALSDINISMVSIGASEVNISIALAERDLDKSVRLLHKEFFENYIDEEYFSSI